MRRLRHSTSHGRRRACRLAGARLALSLCAVAPGAAAQGQGAFQSAVDSLVGSARGAASRNAERHRALETLYARAGHEPLWTRRGALTRQAREAMAALAGSASRGLRPTDYRAEALGTSAAALSASRAPDDSLLAAVDVALSRSLIALVDDLHRGRLDPASLGITFARAGPELDLAAIVLEASQAESLGRVIDTIEPPYAGYAALKQALVRYRELAADTSLVLPDPRRVVRPEDSYPDAPRLRRLLSALGDLPPSANYTMDTTRYAGALVLAMMRFQRRHGLSADGVLGRETIQALRTPLSERVEQIELALERWRWLPRHAPERYIVVNIPAFRLYAFEQDPTAARPVLSMNVVVGDAQTRHDTPIFAGEMRELVFRPYWDVPLRIARNEIVPGIRRGSIDMESEGYEIVGIGAGQRVYPPTRANLAAVAAGTLRIRQRPGAGNALGLVKFVFPNAYDVYLHGTPAVQLFNYARRDFSHGCIRAEQPAVLAEFALCTDGTWTREAIDSAMRSTRTRRVVLPKPVMVYVLYFTAVVAPDGTVHFYPDLYDQDLALQRALDARLR